MIVGLGIIYPQYCLIIRRLKDLDKDLSFAIWIAAISAIFTVVINVDKFFIYTIKGQLLSLILTGIYLYLFLQSGTPGDNKYGEDPLLKN